MKRARSEEGVVDMDNDNNNSSEKGSDEIVFVEREDKDDTVKKPKEERPKPEVIEAHIAFVHASMREVMKRFHDVCVASIGEGPCKSTAESARAQLQEGWKVMMDIFNGILEEAKAASEKSTKDDSDKLLKEFRNVIEGIDENADWTCPICASSYDDQLCIPCKPAENYGEPYNSRYPENERPVVPPTCKHTLCQNCSSAVIANEVSFMSRVRVSHCFDFFSVCTQSKSQCPMCRAWIKSYEYNIGLLESIAAQAGYHYLALSRAYNEALKRTDPLSEEVAKTKAALEKARRNCDELWLDCAKHKATADSHQKAAAEKAAFQQMAEESAKDVERLGVQVANFSIERKALQKANDSLATIVKDSQQVVEAVTEDLIRTRIECMKAGIITASELGVAMTVNSHTKKITAAVKIGTRALGNEKRVEFTKDAKDSSAGRNFLALNQSCFAAMELATLKPPISFDGKLCLATPKDFPEEEDLRRSVIHIEDRPDVVAVRCDSWMASMLSHMTANLKTEELFDNADYQASWMTKNGIPGKGSLYREYPR